MACVHGTIWNHVSVNSKFVLSASGDSSLFDITCGVNVNGVPETAWKHAEIQPGPKKRTLAEDERCAFNVFVVVFSDPPSGKPVHVEAKIELPGGGTDPTKKCSSDFLHAGQFPITFLVSD